jgi:hypothetical protein
VIIHSNFSATFKTNSISFSMGPTGQNIQPVQELRLVGHVHDGLCRAAFKGIFENKQDHPIETSFSLPLSPAAYATDFKVKFNGKKGKCRIATDDSGTLAFDDAIAQSDFAATARVTERNELTIEISAMSPGEKCQISVYFEMALLAIPTGFLLVIPTSISSLSEDFRIGLTPIPLKLKFHVTDKMPIKSITAPFTDKAVIDMGAGTVSSNSVSIFHPFHLVISYVKFPGRCLYQCEKNRVFMRVVATAPRAKRDHPTQFTVLLEQGRYFTSGQMSMIVRALEFFVLSLPVSCRLNFCAYGFSSISSFRIPVEMTQANRDKVLSMIRQLGSATMNKEAAGHRTTLEEVNRQVLTAIPSADMESAVVIIASDLEDVTLPEPHIFFLLDAFARGKMQEVALTQGATYIPVGGEAALIPTLLNVIRMTATLDPIPVSLTVNGTRHELPAVFPAQQVSSFVSVEGNAEMTEVTVHYVDLSLPIAASPPSIPLLPRLWSLDEIRSGRESTLASDILTSTDPVVVSFEREDDFEGDVVHIDARLAGMGIGWIATGKTVSSVPSPIRKVVVRRARPPAHAAPIGAPNPRRFIPPPAHLPSRFADRQQRLPSGPRTVEWRDQLISPEDPVPDKDIPVSAAVALATVTREPIRFKGGRKPFFLLRLLQMQSPDGSWSPENDISSCCGFALPQCPPDRDPLSFATVFALACLRIKAPDNENWQLIHEKAIKFLADRSPDTDWTREISLLQAQLLS